MQRIRAGYGCYKLLLAIQAFGFVVFLNFLVVILTVPALLKMFVGVESPFTFGGWAVFNTTFLAAASGLAYLAVDPLSRAVYVLRCYHGESLTTGEESDQRPGGCPGVTGGG